MKPLDTSVEGAPLEAELRAFDRACEARNEVLAMVDAHRESNGAEAPLPEELRAQVRAHTVDELVPDGWAVRVQCSKAATIDRDPNSGTATIDVAAGPGWDIV